jgi:multiple sugar transport system substrate-binding protein
MKQHRLLALVALLGVLATACGSGGGGKGSTSSTTPQKVTLNLWHGYTDVEAKEFQKLIDEWNVAHPDIQVKTLFVNNDKALQKMTVALQGGKQPDISYQFGSSLSQIATASKLVDLTEYSKQPAVNWNDFIAGAREAVTSQGKVLGVPALIDNLAVVYNKKMFDQAGVAYPNANWTWDDFRAAAKKLTDSSKKQFGFSYPMDASEDSVWHYDPLLWQNGGSILTDDLKKAAFNSPEGVRALETLTRMAVDDKSVFLDMQNSPYTGLFNSGKIGMLITGPWDLASFPDVAYGVAPLPGVNGDHQTIAGPDLWTVWDNGGGRPAAAEQFLTWLTAAEQMKADALATGHLPFRTSVIEDKAFVATFGKTIPGIKVFAENLTNVKQARPVVAAYPQVSEAMGNAIVAAMLGQKSAKQALDQAASEANNALAQSG